MSDLRKRAIRMARANPELREHLLPLLQKTASGKQASFGKPMSKSETKHFLSRNPSWKRRSLVPAFGNKVEPDLTVIAWTPDLKSGIYHYDVFKGDERLTGTYPVNGEREVKALIRQNKPASQREHLLRKTAGDSLMDLVIPQRDMRKLMDKLEDADEQSMDLSYEVYRKLQDKMALARGEQEALRRLQQCVENANRWGPALLRNNIFKAANSLGIRLPSGMF